MKSIKELQQDLDFENKRFNQFRKNHNQDIKEIKQQVIQHAKYTLGQKVNYTHIQSWTKEEIIDNGIIREITPSTGYGDELSVGYVVGKITKSGLLHKSQNITYSPIPENEITIKEA